MKIIDSHAHIFPDKIAEKASFNVGAFYDLAMAFDGKVKTLLNLGDQYSIDQFLVHSVATTPDQVESINNYISNVINKYEGRFIGFATLHPDYKDIRKEIDRAISLGLKGIKLHPDFQRFHIDSKDAMELYEILEGHLPLLIHTGDFRYEYSKPERLARVLDRFPRLQIIAAHFGGWSEWESASEILAGKNVYVDTSSSLYALSPEKARSIIERFGVDHVLFGSDYPMWNPGEEIQRVKALELDEADYEKIMHLNIEKLLNLAT